jgi:hypothetical protein
MNTCDCDILNPLQRDGTSQLQRLMKSLDPGYVLVDERKLQDLLLFAKKYAALIRYYDLDNTATNNADWVSFIENDITTVISGISRTDTAAIRATYKTWYEKTIDQPTFANLKGIFEYIHYLGKMLNTWYVQSADGLLLRKELQLNIKSTLEEGFRKLNYYASKVNTINAAWSISLNNTDFNIIWNITNPLYTPGTEPPAIFVGATQAEKIKNGTDSLTALFNLFYNALLKINARADAYLDEALTKYPSHQPHFALFITFLELFKISQDDLNAFTKRHLEFYYKEVLGLKERPPVPDQVYLVFDLAKNFKNYDLKSGTQFKAGKDTTNTDLLYATDNELVVNNTAISALKTVFLQRDLTQDSKPITQVYASPVANSKDGKGKAFDKDQEPKWSTLGNAQPDMDGNITMPVASVGYSIASPQLILNEGTRIITVTVTFDSAAFAASPLPTTDCAQDFEFYLSGKKGYIQVPSAAPATGGSGVSSTFNNNQWTITITLDETQPDIVPYHKDLGGTYVTNWPLLKVVFSNTNNPYEYLKDLQITAIKIDNNVTDLKNLVLQNDFGVLKSSKPFQPFGPVPVTGSALYIGSEEIFNKKVDSLTLIIDWMGLPSANFDTYYAQYADTPGTTNASDLNNTFTVAVDVLSDKSWNLLSNTGSDANYPLFKDDFTAANGSRNDLGLINVNTKRSDNYVKVIEYGNDTQLGFIKLMLTRNFLHKEYPNYLTNAVITKATGGTATLPNPPYTPVIKTLTANYTSSQDFDVKQDQFFHIYPFGEAETTPSDSSTNENKLIQNTAYLAPQFTYNHDLQEGALFIGLQSLVPPQNLSILFDAAEGSGDAEFTAPHINWRYLSNNQWYAFSIEDLLSDTTNGLLTTGIVQFAIPEDITNNNTILPAGQYWISASVKEHSSTVSQLFDLKPQAITASFRDQKNDPNHLAQPLAANTISKMLVKAAEIKSVSQPYASFGGKLKEQGKDFYIRVSERLRHKHRAIDIWDYERLVLQHFPSVYKVKCLNHTSPCSEMTPGHVTIIPISNLRNKNSKNILRPSTSADTLSEIGKYLNDLNPPFVNLHVQNPDYQEIFTKFNVFFYKGIDEGFYLQKLNQDIIQFLTPWAFSDATDISFGGKMHASVIIDFIEELSYVDYLTDFEMYFNKGNAPVEEAVATNSRSILVSAKSHCINNPSCL